MPSKTNQRHHRRVPCGAPAKADGPRGPMRGVCRTLSSMGLFFVGPSLPVGQSLHFTVELPGGAFEAEGEVRYHHTTDEGRGMGVRFTRIAQDDLAKVQKFIGAVP